MISMIRLSKVPETFSMQPQMTGAKDRYTYTGLFFAILWRGSPKIIAKHFVECDDCAQYFHLVYQGLGVYFQSNLAIQLAGPVGKVPGRLDHASQT